MKVSVITVTRNSLGDITRCLRALEAQDFRDWELIIVDNASGDGTAEYLKSECGRYRLIFNERNEGFCKANNDAVKIAGGEYILFLNPDVELKEDHISTLFRAMESDPGLGSVTGKLLKDRDARTIDSTGIVFRKYSLIPVDRGEGEVDNGQYAKDGDVFGASCACAMYRRRALDDVEFGGQYFDEDFFAYFEDVDLAWRVNSRGWKSRYIASCVGYHDRKGDRSKDIRTRMLAFRNAYLAVIKNAGREDISAVKVAYNFGALMKKLITRPYLFMSVPEMAAHTPKAIRRRIKR